MILPERVLGRPEENCILSGVAMGPMTLRTCTTSSFLRSSLGSTPLLRVT
jgi:hypothetical protein